MSRLVYSYCFNLTSFPLYIYPHGYVTLAIVSGSCSARAYLGGWVYSPSGKQTDGQKRQVEVFLRHVYMHVCECSQRYAYGLGVYRIRKIQWYGSCLVICRDMRLIGKYVCFGVTLVHVCDAIILTHVDVYENILGAGMFFIIFIYNM